jgi:sulfur carrier protein ThiS
MVNVFMQREKKRIKIDACSVRELLNKLELNPGTVIIAKNNEVVIEDELLNPEDDIKIVPVISGG